MTDLTQISTMSVNDILRRWPASMAALNALGVDTCCGGGLPLEEAAGEIGLPVTVLVDAIARSIAAEVAR